jgi:2,3-bisphosphoglycerate-independent phosphoglycerate mutase
MKDHSAGGISNAEAQAADLRSIAACRDLPGLSFITGVSYRNLLVYRGNEEFDVETRPPHEIPEEPIAKHLPRGSRQRDSPARSWTLEASSSPITKSTKRGCQTGFNPATQVWLWGQGHAPNMPTNSKGASASKPAA